MSPPDSETNVAAVVSAMETYANFEEVAVRQLMPANEEDAAEIGQYAVVPNGKTLVSVKKFIDEYRTQPERRAGTATLSTLASFIDHVKRFADEHTAVFADVDNRKNAQLVSVLDYHEKTAAGQPRFGQHRGVYKFPLSDEWHAWNSGADNPMNMAAFAQFLEDRIMDVLDPTAGGDTIKEFAVNLGITLATAQRLMELSRGLAIRVEAKVSQAVNLSSGEGQMTFSESHGTTDGGAIKIPGGFAITIPVFRNGPLYKIPVRLRYRVQQGSVVWWYSPQRIDRVWDHAITEACDTVADETERQLFYGKPEA